MFKSVLVASASVAAGTLGKSTYAMTHPFAYKAWMEKYISTGEHVIQENSTELCNEWVKLCIDDGNTPFTCSGQYNPQIHAVGAYARETGTLSLETIEDYFTQALGGMKKYDPFMEMHVAFHTADLDSYISAFTAGSVPYFPSTFVDPATSKSYDSVLVQVDGSLKTGAGSLLVLELVGSSSRLVDRTKLHQHATPRASSSSLQRAERLATSSGLTQLHVSWPSSNVTRDKEYFLTVLGGTAVSHESKNGAESFSGKLFSDDTVELRWASAASESSGPWKVSDWEKYGAALHSQCLHCPNPNNQGFDRLADNHVGGHGGSGGVTGALDDYITAQISAGMPYRVYAAPTGTPNFLYLYGPNGWGYQITGHCTTASNCGTNLVFYDECKQGVTGSCDTDLPSQIAVVV